ncbi:MAG: hypothetical protein QME28_03030 [Candidatus Saccharicenans sp.]|nr:hypothetical protein [Candidatus Saccharicenans sp.]
MTVLLLFSCLLAFLMFIFKPIAQGHRYDLALKLSIELLAVWLVFICPARWLNKKTVLATVLLTGLALGLFQIKSLKPDREIISTYRSVFQDLEEGRNPYTSGQIYHRDASGQVVYHNFNYPPLELWPYYFFYRIFRRWNEKSLALFLMSLQLLAGLIVVLAFRKIRPFPLHLLFFLPLLVFSEIKTNPGMTMLMVSLFILLLSARRKGESLALDIITASVIGLGVLTKFLFSCIAITFYLWQLYTSLKKNSQAELKQTALMISISFLVALMAILPFGPLNVFKSTILFNLNPGERNLYTTFYPNVLSGPLYLIDKNWLYPPVAIGAFLLALWTVRKMSLFPAMLFVSTVFLLVAPTPEPQYFGTMLLLALAGNVMENEPAVDPEELKSRKGAARTAI